MTYLEYVQILYPECVKNDGFVMGCPNEHGLPSVACDSTCAECYANNIVPEDIAEKAATLAWWHSDIYDAAQIDSLLQ